MTTIIKHTNRDKPVEYCCESAQLGSCPDMNCTYAKRHVHGGLHESKAVQVQCPKNLTAWFSCVAVH